MKLLEMKHIKKEFDGLGVLKDISLAVEEGEILSIIGPSGSGKSTLLRCANMHRRRNYIRSVNVLDWYSRILTCSRITRS